MISLPGPRTRSTQPALAAAGLLLVLAAAGCTPSPDGGGDGTPSASGRSSSVPSSSVPSTSPPSVGAGSDVQCPALSATVPTGNAEDGSFSASAAGTPALTRSDGGTSAVSGATITKTGDAAEPPTPDGTDAAVRVSAGSRLLLTDSTVDSAQNGAYGVFSTGTGSLVELDRLMVTTGGSAAPAVGAAAGGAVTGTELTLTAAGNSAAAIEAGNEGAEISIHRSTATAGGEQSAAIRSTGSVSVCGLAGTSRSAEAAAVEGGGTVTSTRSGLTGATHGVTFSGGTPGGRGGGTLTVSGGTLAGQDGNAVLIQGVPATVTIDAGAELTAGSGVLISVTGGGTGTVSLEETNLDGTLAAEAGSSLQVSFTANSSLSGTLSNVGVSLDNTSRISLQGDSAAAAVAGALLSGSEVINITGNGHTLTYDPADPANSYLDSRTYTLAQGGTLAPR